MTTGRKRKCSSEGSVQSRARFTSEYSASEAMERLREFGSAEKAKFALRYFKTGPGEYGEGDKFLGVNAAQQRSILVGLDSFPMEEIEIMLSNEYHDARLSALLALVRRYELAVKARDTEDSKAIVNFYLSHTDHINNWDLVDCSCYKILGHHLYHSVDMSERARVIDDLVRSDSLWERRIAAVSMLYFIRENRFTECLSICSTLLEDKQDLIHKACGWMLREIGKRSQKAEETFLKEKAFQMPRVMLRYAIERFTPQQRKKYLDARQPLS